MTRPQAILPILALLALACWAIACGDGATEPPPPRPPPTRWVAESDTVRLAAEATGANGHAVAGAEFAWSSSDTAVATVDATGLVTGTAAGETEITARSSGVAGRAALMVVVAKLNSAPPEWVFTGDLPEADRTRLQKEMGRTRAYFAHRHGMQATGFTVLVGADYESLEPAYRAATGAELSSR